jgi:hypothetical protein
LVKGLGKHRVFHLAGANFELIQKQF